MTAAADSQIGTGFSRRCDARQCIGNRFAVDEQDALVAGADFRDKALCHDRLCVACGHDLENDVQVVVALANTKD